MTAPDGTGGLPVAALRRLLVEPPDGAEACDLCGDALPAEHAHVADVGQRVLRCACATCVATLGPDAGPLRRIPPQVERLQGRTAEDVWEGLGAPVGVLFLVLGDDGAWTATYPGAAGAVTAVLDPGQLASSVAGLGLGERPMPEVQALLLDRRRGRPPSGWIVPIDRCYALSTILREAWRGIDGGPGADDAVVDFLDGLRRDRADQVLGPAIAVADAVLHEGQVLYPYRADAHKNRWRWAFGLVWPRPWAAHPDAEPWWATATFLVRAAGDADVTVRVRHQHLERRERDAPTPQEADWDEATLVTHDLTVPLDRLEPVEGSPRDPAGNPVGRDLPLRVAGGVTTRRLEDGSPERRTRAPIDAVAHVVARPIGAWHLVTVRVENLGLDLGESPTDRIDHVRRSLVSTQILLAVPDGEVGSLRTPAPDALAAVGQAVSERLWPVVVDRHTAIATPLVLPEPPRLADRSTGELCDALEIEEMMALRVRTLLPEEKAAAIRTDPVGAGVVARLDGLDQAGLARLHADADRPGSGTVVVGGRVVGVGSRVRLRPTRQADAFDMALDGRTAVVDAVMEDLDGATLLRVTVDGDPGADLLRETGRGFHFGPDEVEPLADVLVAGVGNVFRGDDGFGPAVIAELRRRGHLPGAVQLEDYGIRGVHLAWDLSAFRGTVVLVDAIDLDAAAGTVVLLAPADVPDVGPVDGHDLRLPAVLARAKELGGSELDVVVLGCVPASLDDGMALSEVVAAAVSPAADRVVGLVEAACKDGAMTHDRTD